MFCLSNKDEFQCKSDECIKWSYVCDGISHCSNKADEDCDMCTNDLYLCKDSSRINCTLACSTLGYIPCKNYIDKKICASVNKKSASSSLLNRYGHNDLFNQNGSFLKNLISNEKLLVTALGIFVFLAFVILFLLFGVLYNRNKQKKRGFSTRTVDIMNQNDITNSNNINNNNNLNNKQNNKFINFKSHSLSIVSLSNHSLINPDFDERQMIKKNENGKAYFKINKNDDKLLNKKSESNEFLSNENKKNESVEYQLYGEPPPSYKQSKYYPKAAIKLESKNCSKTEPLLKHEDSIEEEKYAHIYENIDEIDDSQENERLRSNKKDSNLNKKLTGNKRARFQGLKKNSLGNTNRLSKNLENNSEQVSNTNNEEKNKKAIIVLSDSISSTSSVSSTSSMNRNAKSNQKDINNLNNRNEQFI